MQIEKKFQVKVDAATLLTASTVRTLSKLVEYQLLIGNVTAEPAIKGKSELVLIQQGTSRHPIFLVHPVGGMFSFGFFFFSLYLYELYK